MNERSQQLPQQPWTFSISNLLLWTTVVALVIAMVQLLGPVVIPLVLICMVAVIGGVAHGQDNAPPFWAALGSGVATTWGLPLLLAFRPTTLGVVAGCFYVGLAICLAYYSIRAGHWTTKLLVLLVVIPYVAALYSLLI